MILAYLVYFPWYLAESSKNFAQEILDTQSPKRANGQINPPVFCPNNWYQNLWPKESIYLSNNLAYFEGNFKRFNTLSNECWVTNKVASNFNQPIFDLQRYILTWTVEFLIQKFEFESLIFLTTAQGMFLHV